MVYKTVSCGTALALAALLGACTAPAPPPYAVSPAPRKSEAPAAGNNGHVTPSYGSGYNPETGVKHEGE